MCLKTDICYNQNAHLQLELKSKVFINAPSVFEVQNRLSTHTTNVQNSKILDFQKLFKPIWEPAAIVNKSYTGRLRWDQLLLKSTLIGDSADN